MVDICETTTFDATYTVTAPDALTVPTVAPTEVSACDFGYDGTSTDKAAAQAALETAFDTWMADVLAAFNSGVGGGCAPIATPTWDGTYPDICGDAVTITWDVVDICETTTFDATYTVTAPDALTYHCGTTEVSACDFGYNGTSTDKAAAQAALEHRI